MHCNFIGLVVLCIIFLLPFRLYLSISLSPPPPYRPLFHFLLVIFCFPLISYHDIHTCLYMFSINQSSHLVLSLKSNKLIHPSSIYHLSLRNFTIFVRLFVPLLVHSFVVSIDCLLIDCYQLSIFKTKQKTIFEI